MENNAFSELFKGCVVFPEHVDPLYAKVSAQWSLPYLYIEEKYYKLEKDNSFKCPCSKKKIMRAFLDKYILELKKKKSCHRLEHSQEKN